VTGRALSRRQWLGLAAISLGALGLGHYLRRGQPLGRDVSDIMDVRALLEAPGYPIEGPEDARLTMLVFSDYACAVCRKVEPWWREAVREAGDVRIVHRDWPILGPASVRAARVALAAGRQGLYAPVHQILMRTGRHDETALRQALTAAGGDWDRLETDLAKDGAAIDRLLARTARDAFQLGFRGTPGYLIGRLRIEGGASQRQFADAIDRTRDDFFGA
jgi:protein-disulfide isomerase